MTTRNVLLAIVLIVSAPVLCFLAACCLGIVFGVAKYALFDRPAPKPVSIRYVPRMVLSSAASSTASAPKMLGQ